MGYTIVVCGGPHKCQPCQCCALQNGVDSIKMLHEVQVYPSKGKWLCGDEQCFAVLVKFCICYPET